MRPPSESRVQKWNDAKAKRQKDRREHNECRIAQCTPAIRCCNPRKVAWQREHCDVAYANGDQHPRSKMTGQ